MFLIGHVAAALSALRYTTVQYTYICNLQEQERLGESTLFGIDYLHYLYTTSLCIFQAGQFNAQGILLSLLNLFNSKNTHSQPETYRGFGVLGFWGFCGC